MAEQKVPGNNRLQQFSLSNRLLMFFLLWVIISAGYVFFFGKNNFPRQIPYSVFKTQVENGKVAEIAVKGQEITGQYKPKDTTETQGAPDKKPVSHIFTTVMPSFPDPQLESLSFQEIESLLHLEEGS
jgi:ATP-dependent Zn protease